jgi:hypothetical protein
MIKPADQRRVLVASVYAPSSRNEIWLRLQRQFLARVLQGRFTLAIWLNGVEADLFAGTTIIGHSNGPRAKLPSSDHAQALQGVVKYFESQPNYDDYLILDSDAFPIRANWLETLLNWLAPRPQIPERWFAAPARLENLDTFPHPCAFFIRGEFFRGNPGWFNFEPGQTRNLIGATFADTGAAIRTEKDGLNIWQPLTRTNTVNLHPILGAVYGDLFYHHGCGSRKLVMRAIKSGQFDHHISHKAHAAAERRLFENLLADPIGLMDRLTTEGGSQRTFDDPPPGGVSVHGQLAERTENP